MNFAHVHLLINHLPVAGLIFGLIILCLSWYFNNESFARAGYLVLIISGIFSVAAFFTGDPAEDVIRNLPTFSKNLVHQHELAAQYAVWFGSAVGLLAAFDLWFSIRKKLTPKKFFIGLVLLNAFTLTVVARTNYLGGLISHPEIRSE